VQLPDDPAEDLAVVPTESATRLLAGRSGYTRANAWSVNSNIRRYWLVCFQERDPIEQHHHQQPSAAALLGQRNLKFNHQGAVVAERGSRHPSAASPQHTRGIVAQDVIELLHGT
jgi:hypothetical protein